MNESAIYHLTQGTWKEKAEELCALAMRPYSETKVDPAAEGLKSIAKLLATEYSEDNGSTFEELPASAAEDIMSAALGALAKSNEHARYNELMSEILTFWDLRWSELKEILAL